VAAGCVRRTFEAISAVLRAAVLTGELEGGRPLEIVIALDDPEFVITVIPRRKRR
jgi:hypothetical protein